MRDLCEVSRVCIQAGADGFCIKWNPKRKTKIWIFPTAFLPPLSFLLFPSSYFSSPSYSSYMYEDETQDDKQHPDDAIFIRRVTDQETKPK